MISPSDSVWLCAQRNGDVEGGQNNSVNLCPDRTVRVLMGYELVVRFRGSLRDGFFDMTFDVVAAIRATEPASSLRP